jgi:uncharacterized membrane protein
MSFLAATAFASPAAAQKDGGSGADQIVIRVCNNTPHNVRVALSYQPVGSDQFYNQGWFGVAASACQDLAATGNAYAYGYAEVENDGTRYWAGDHPLCVEYPGPYAFWTTTSEYCDGKQESRNFATMHATDWGVYTWTLTP